MVTADACCFRIAGQEREAVWYSNQTTHLNSPAGSPSSNCFHGGKKE